MTPAPSAPVLPSTGPTAPAGSGSASTTPSPAPVAATPAAAASPPQAASARSPQDGAPARPARLDARLAATDAWLKDAPADAYALQLMTIDPARARELDRWLARASSGLPVDRVYVFSARTRGESTRLHVVLGTYPTREEAQVAAKSLPAKVAANKPQPRSLAHIRTQVDSQ
jgi:septal ring-binding cell division protein DamX